MTANQKTILSLAKRPEKSNNYYLYSFDVVNYYKRLGVTNPDKSAYSAITRLKKGSYIRKVSTGIYKVL